MSEISKKIIEEIHERHVTHRPRWYFLIKNASVWFMLLIAIFLGALSINIEESVLEKTSCTAPSFFMADALYQSIFLLSVLATLAFIVLAFLNLRLTNEGYRFGGWWALIGIMLAIGACGFVLKHQGLGDRAERMIEQHSLFHHSPPPEGSESRFDDACAHE